MPLVAMNNRWELMRLSSLISMRIQTARSGTSMSRSFSVARLNASSVKNGEA